VQDICSHCVSHWPGGILVELQAYIFCARFNRYRNYEHTKQCEDDNFVTNELSSGTAMELVLSNCDIVDVVQIIVRLELLTI